MRLDERDGPVTCPFCRAEILGGEKVLSCVRCSTKHHAECAFEVPRCTVMGCGGRFSQQSYRKLVTPAAAVATVAVAGVGANADPVGSGCLWAIGEFVGEILFQGLGELLVQLICGLF